MICSNELRIGNIVVVTKRKEQIIVVSSLLRTLIACYNAKGEEQYWGYYHLRSFPLTMDILVKNCEFKNNVDNIFEYTDADLVKKLIVRWDAVDSCFYVDMSGTGLDDIIITSLHQLQNVFYIFFEKELQIKF